MERPLYFYARFKIHTWKVLLNPILFSPATRSTVAPISLKVDVILLCEYLVFVACRLLR
jgi:hypothetical protein